MKYSIRWLPERFAWNFVYEFPDGRWFNLNVLTHADIDSILADPEEFYQNVYSKRFEVRRLDQ